MLKLLFGLTLPVDRRTYAIAGVTLMALKLGVDQLVLYSATGKPWGFWQYMSFTMLDDKVPSTANNTAVSTRGGNTTLLRLSTQDESADVRNNILYTTAAGNRLAMLNAAGDRVAGAVLAHRR